MTKRFKNHFLIFLSIFTLTFSGCEKLEIERGTPKCIKQSIKSFNRSNLCEHHAKVVKYLFQGGFVYVFVKGNCDPDLEADVVDSGCFYLGYIGGIDGNFTINGGDFRNAEYVSTVWER